MDVRLSPDDLHERVARYRWWHVIDLGNGVKTPGFYDPVGKQHAPRFAVPHDLSGKTVLDIGSWDGAWSFEAKRRGAARVLATDKYSWGYGGWGDREAFLLARDVLELDVEDQLIDVLELSRENVGQFDIVFFFGVIYHMRHPMLALERLRDVTKPGGLAIVETHCDMLDNRKPALAFYPGRELLGDDTNWFGPNPAAMTGMLRASGFSDVSLQWLSAEEKRMTLHAR